MTVIHLNTIGKKIKSLRLKLGWSQVKFAHALGVKGDSVSRWESGVSVPSLERLRHIAALGDMTLEEFVRNDHADLKLFSTTALKMELVRRGIKPNLHRVTTDELKAELVKRGEMV